MPRNVTVVFADGQAKVYTDVPDDVTPDQIEAEARRQYPDFQISKIMGEDIVLVELRDAIASRTATMSDLEEIARRYNRTIPEDARRSFQSWLDTARDRPDVPIPENLFTGPVSQIGAVLEGLETGARSVADTLTSAWAWLADKGAQLGITPTPENATRIFARINAYSPEEADAFARNIAERGLSWSDLVSAGSEAVRARPSAIEAQTQRGNYFTTGDIVSRVGLTAVPIGALARGGAAAASAVNLPTAANLFRSIGQGGIGVRAATPAAVAAGAPTATSMGGRLALRVAGGAGSGATGAALTGEDVATDAAVGGVIPIIGTIGRRGMGVTFDFLAGRIGETRAAEVMRNLIADKPAEIIAALRAAPENVRVNTAEFLASRGLLTPEIAAATRVTAASTSGRQLQDIATARAAGQDEMLNTLRGGETGTEAMQNLNAMRQSVRTETDPLRVEQLGRSDIGRTQIIPLEQAASAADALAAEINNSGIVRRMRGLESRSREQLDTMFQNPSFFTLDGPAARTGEIADQAGRRADEGIEAQLRLRGVAEEQRRAAANLRAQGLSPLDIAGVVGSLRSAARDARFVNTPRDRVLSAFADNLVDRARMMGGVIDAGGLYELRKGMNEQIATLLEGTDPSSLQRRTAELVGEIKPLIDDAIEAAGGAGWREYLNRFTAGMQNVERQEFSRRLAGLPRNRLERVMSGNDPKFVSDFFGPGNYDINAALFGSQLPVAQRLAGEIDVDRQVAALGMRGLPTETGAPVRAGVRERVTEAMSPGLSSVSRAFFNVTGRIPGVSGGGIAAEQLAREFSQRMSQNAMRSLAPALANPADAARLAGVRSLNAMTAGAFDSLSPTSRAAVAQTLQGMMNPPVAPPEVLLGFETGPDGQEYPIYGPAGGR